MDDRTKLIIIQRHHNINRAQKLDSRNKIRDYAYFANSVRFAKKYILQIFFLSQAQNLLYLFFFGQIEISSGK